MPAANLDLKSVRNYLTSLDEKLTDLGRHL